MTGAERLVAALEAHDVEVVFGLPGVHNLPAWEAVRASAIRLIGVRHEQAAAYAADGYARATGKLGVALVTTGPGAANCVAATGEAYASGSPVVVVATDIPSALRREGVVRGVLHETADQAALFAPVTKAQLQAAPGDDVAELFARAAHLALSPPRRPVYLGIPTDLLPARSRRAKTHARPIAPEVPQPDAGALDAAKKLVAAAARPLVFAGTGARGAAAEVAGFAARIGAPLVTTFGAAGLHDSALAPPHEPAIGALWDAADLVIGVGTDLDGVDTQNWAMPRPPKLIQVNVDAADAVKNWEPDVLVVGDAACVASISGRAKPWYERPSIAVEDPQAEQFLAALDEALPPDAAVVCDMCIPGYWVGGYRPSEGLQYPIGWGTLGFGFPAAIGAALSRRATVAVCGDGGFLFACGELATIEQERVPLTVILFDDGGYGMLRHDGGDPFRLHTPDFAALAAAFGVHAEAVRLERLAAALANHVLDPAPSLLIVKAELPPPPTTSPRWYRVRR
jgi:thiamine pyrophosphate-dependent acetolactate synthase large subunit-like protein